MKNYFCISPAEFAALNEQQRESLANFFYVKSYGVHCENNVEMPMVKGYSAGSFKIPGARNHIYDIIRHLDATIPPHPFFYIQILPDDAKKRIAVFNRPDFFAIAASFEVFGGHPRWKLKWRISLNYGVFWRAPRPVPEVPEVTLIVA